MANEASSSSSTVWEEEFIGADSGWVEARTSCDHLSSLSSDLSQIPIPDSPCTRDVLQVTSLGGRLDEEEMKSGGIHSFSLEASSPAHPQYPCVHAPVKFSSPSLVELQDTSKRSITDVENQANSVPHCNRKRTYGV